MIQIYYNFIVTIEFHQLNYSQTIQSGLDKIQELEDNDAADENR